MFYSYDRFLVDVIYQHDVYIHHYYECPVFTICCTKDCGFDMIPARLSTLKYLKLSYLRLHDP